MENIVGFPIPTAIGKIKQNLEQVKRCCFWRGDTTENGLPLVYVRKDFRSVRVRDFLWSMKNGRIPKNGVIETRCGNKLCCKESHLVLSVRRVTRTFTEDEILHILNSSKDELYLSKYYNTDKKVISNVLSGDYWKPNTITKFKEKKKKEVPTLFLESLYEPQIRSRSVTSR